MPPMRYIPPAVLSNVAIYFPPIVEDLELSYWFAQTFNDLMATYEPQISIISFLGIFVRL